MSCALEDLKRGNKTGNIWEKMAVFIKGSLKIHRVNVNFFSFCEDQCSALSCLVTKGKILRCINHCSVLVQQVLGHGVLM